jgi:hypothetical protein
MTRFGRPPAKSGRARTNALNSRAIVGTGNQGGSRRRAAGIRTSDLRGAAPMRVTAWLPRASTAEDAPLDPTRGKPVPARADFLVEQRGFELRTSL